MVSFVHPGKKVWCLLFTLAKNAWCLLGLVSFVRLPYLLLYFSYITIILAGIASLTLCHCTDGKSFASEFNIMLLVRICQKESKLVLKLSLPTF